VVNSSETADGRSGHRRRGAEAARAATIASAGLGLVGLALVTAACSGAADDTEGATIFVFAAASLTDVMAEAELAFEAANPAIDVTLNVAGSASLRTQILEGAPADVIVTANPAIMEDLVDAGQVTDRPATLARNELVIAVAPGNPADITGLDDLADPDRFIGLCASEVPCGDLADRAAAAADIVIDADTREPDVRSLLTKVTAGELDAGLVYRTDVAAAANDDLTAIDLPAQLPTSTDYPVAALAGSEHPAEAETFVAFLAGPEGRRILIDHGFQVP